MFSTTPLLSQPKGGRRKIAVSRLSYRNGQGYSPPRLYKPTSAVGVDTVVYFGQMRESSFGMFRGDIGVACFTMLNGFCQMLHRFLQTRIFASPPWLKFIAENDSSKS